MRAESGVFGDGGGRPIVRRGPKPRLLVVDDDAMVDAAVDSSFCVGFDVEVARGLEAARAMLGGHEEFDVVLSGVDLPDGSGLEIVPEVCGAGLTTELVFLSADPRLEDAVYAIKAGAFEFLRKPFHVPDLLGVLDAAIERRPACEVRDQSDLGDLPVTVAVGALAPASIDTALANGLACARELVSRGLIGHALLNLAGCWAQTGDGVASTDQQPSPGRSTLMRAA